ncbi:MAG: 5-oxoprolinase subunit PxpB [Alphaproteobacteria bacterium]
MASETIAQPKAKASPPRFVPMGDTALMVVFGEVIDRDVNARVLAFDAALREAALPGVIEAVPTFCSLTVHLDPCTTTPAEVAARLAPLLPQGGVERPEGRTWNLPVCYDGDYAPDLAEVGERTGLGRDGVVAAHTRPAYDVFMLGFLPGFGFMGPVEPALALNRRAEPRTRLPAGSVGIAIGLTCIYPYESPGGWHLIGRSPVALFDLRRSTPALLTPGDKVRFEPVDAAAYEALLARAKAGTLGPDDLREQA